MHTDNIMGQVLNAYDGCLDACGATIGQDYFEVFAGIAATGQKIVLCFERIFQAVLGDSRRGAFDSLHHAGLAQAATAGRWDGESVVLQGIENGFIFTAVISMVVVSQYGHKFGDDKPCCLVYSRFMPIS